MAKQDRVGGRYRNRNRWETRFGPVGRACPIRLEVVRKGLRIRMGEDSAEIAEGAGVGEWGKRHIGGVFNNCLGVISIKFPKMLRAEPPPSAFT